MSGLNPDGLGNSETFNNIDGQSVTTDQLTNIYTYVVDPTDDLNDIINNQLSAGESVWLGLGTHTVSKSGLQALLISVDNITVHGPGMGLSTIKLEDNASTDAGSQNDEAVLMLGASGGNAPSGIELKGFSIDGNDTNQSTASNERIHGIKPHDASDVVIENVEIFDCTGGGFWRSDDADTGSNYAIRNLDIHDVYQDGFLLSSDDVTVERLKVENTANQDGVEPKGKNHTYSDCLVRNVTGSAFDLFGAENVLVENAIAVHGSNGPGTAFKFGGESGDTTRNSSFENCLYIGSNDSGQADYGFEYQDPHEGCVVADCISYQQGGIQQATTDGETYDGLRIIDPQGTGFEVDGSDVTVDIKIINAQNIGAITTSNSVNCSGEITVDTTNGADGMQTAGTDHRIEPTVLSAGNGGSGNDGILVTGSNITLETPYVEGSDRYGIFLNGADNVRALDSHTKNNGNWGLELSGTMSDITIENPIIDGDSFGITIASSVSDTRINNRTYRNLGSNLLSDSGTRTLINNHCKQALGGSGPDATNFQRGDTVEDTDNSGDVYLVIDPSTSGGHTQIGT